MSRDDDSVCFVGNLGEGEVSLSSDSSDGSSSDDSSSGDSSGGSSSSEVSPGPLLLGLVLTMVPGQDSVLSGSPSVRSEAPSSELEVLS